jgi:hypothetical protein
MVVHACNFSYTGGRERRIEIQGQSRPKKKKSKTISLKQGGAWWFTPIVPAMEEA